MKDANTLHAPHGPYEAIADGANSGKVDLSYIEALRLRIEGLLRADRCHLQDREDHFHVRLRLRQLSFETRPEDIRDRHASCSAGAERIITRAATGRALRGHVRKPLIRTCINHDRAVTPLEPQ